MFRQNSKQEWSLITCNEALKIFITASSRAYVGYNLQKLNRAYILLNCILYIPTLYNLILT